MTTENHPLQSIVESLPVYLNNHCVVVLQKFISESDFSTMIMWEYFDVMKQTEFAAQQLIKSIRDQCSIHFLQQLRKACADEIIAQNEKYNTNHSIDLEDK